MSVEEFSKQNKGFQIKKRPYSNLEVEIYKSPCSTLVIHIKVGTRGFILIVILILRLSVSILRQPLFN